MNNIFLVDKNIISYQDMIDFLNNDKIFNDLSEVESFIFDFLKKILNENVSDEKILNFEDLIIKIKNSSYKIILKTSGTTGKPKEIYHTIDSITKNIIVDNKYSYSIWGMCYPVGKMAFYQVFFQSIFNKSKLINLYGYSFEEIESKIIENKISNLSATPTFYKMLISDGKIFDSVKLVTLGGEGVEEKFIDKLKNNFPNSSIKNIYASSETASLLRSSNNVFSIPEKYKNKIKIFNNLIYIHKSLLGEINNFDYDSEWYDTQDKVEFINEFEFKIIGRKNVEFNISGFKVNPFRVESVINSLSYVQNSVVYSKKNSVIGNILCCDIILNQSIKKKQIKYDLSLELEKYEVPSIINFVNFLVINNSMKIERV